MEELSLHQLNAMNMSDLQHMMTRLDIVFPSNFIEKSELVQALLKSDKVSLVPTDASQATSPLAAEEVDTSTPSYSTQSTAEPATAEPTAESTTEPTTDMTAAESRIDVSDGSSECVSHGGQEEGSNPVRECPLCTYINDQGSEICQMCENRLPFDLANDNAMVDEVDEPSLEGDVPAHNSSHVVLPPIPPSK